MRSFLRVYAVVIVIGVLAAGYSYYSYTQERESAGVSTTTTTPAAEAGGEAAASEPESHQAEGDSVTLGGYTVRVDTADTPQERQQGLSGRAGLADDEGMLFVFPEDGIHRFWMKDMRFSIDILWLDNAGKIVHIVPDAAPESYPASFSSEIPARYVLEVPAGFSERHSIGVGSVAVLPR